MTLPKFNSSWLAWAGLALLAGAVGYLSGGKVVIPTPPPPDEPVFVASFGWVDDPTARDAAIKAAGISEFAATPAGQAALATDEVFLWRSVRVAAGRAPTEKWYPNINQGSVGSCVGAGWKHGTDVAVASQSARDGTAWSPVSAEAIYAGSRVQIGKGQIRGDGSLGAWAADFVRTYGVTPMAKYGDLDLTSYSAARARQWGSPGAGLPAYLVEVTRKHPVQTTAKVSSWIDVQRAVGQGYPVPVCSMQGFDGMNRDAEGFAAPRGEWPHCMCFIAIRGGARPGAFCLNSWGDDAHRGPVYPDDAPTAGFWVDAKTVDKMVRQGDSYAISDVAGFPARKIDWFADARPVPAVALPAPKMRDDTIALAW